MQVRSFFWIRATLTWCVGAWALAACGSDTTPCQGSACGAVDGGNDVDVVVGPHDASSDGAPVTDGSKLPDGAMGDGAAEAGPPVCDKSADPKDSPACVADADGVFVDAAGSDSNSGTKEAPLQSIGKGITKAQGGLGRVYVCAGSYAETVNLTSAVSVYGGFACGTYAYSGILPVVTAAVGSSALTITGVNNVTIEDMEFVSQDATGTDASGNGNSSIAAFISSSSGVTIKRSTFKAGAGAAAAAGSTTGTSFAAPAQMGISGTATAGGAGLPKSACANGSGSTSSGNGGTPISGGNGGGMGASDPVISPVYPSGDNGAPGGSSDCTTNGPHGGSYGPGGPSGPPATIVGSLASGGWTPSSGGAGAVGGVGEGGGGGGSLDATGGGGSGSAGGCGGDGGKGGAGGGASIGIALFASPASFLTLTIQSEAAGQGGTGSKGGTGQDTSGGGGGFMKGCQGAIGGYGGSGGGGGGGTGGVSAGVLWTGAAPTIDGVVTNNAAVHANFTVPATPAAAGAGGAGGDAVQSMARGGQAGSVGLAGVAEAVLGI